MNTLRTLPLLRPSRSSTPSQRTPDNAVQHPQHGTMGPPPVGVPTPRSRSASRPHRFPLVGGTAGGGGAGGGGGGGGGVTNGSTMTAVTAPTATNGTVAVTVTATANATGASGGNSPPHRSSTPRVPASTHGGLGALPPNVLPPGGGPIPREGSSTPSLEGLGPAGGFIDAIGLRLNEQVNRTCVAVDPKTKKGIRKGAGWQLGEMVVREFPSPDADTYLLRAVLRTAIRSLTVYVSRLEYLVLPALTDPAFTAPLNLNGTAATAQQLNPTQSFAVSICHSAWETCEVLEMALIERKPAAFPRFVPELLRPVMDKLDSVVARVVTPLMGNLKRELVLSLESAAHSPVVGGTTKGLPTNANVVVPTPPTHVNGGHGSVVVNAKVVNNMPLCLKAFAQKVEGARKVFELVCRDCKDDGESWVTSVVVAVIWKGMVSCQTRYALQGNVPTRDENGRPPSPDAMAKALAALAVEPKLAPPPPAGPVSAVGKMASILPSRPVSRPPSPPRKSGEFGGRSATAASTATATADPTALYLATFEILVQRLVDGLVLPPAKAPADPNATENLAREALGEAIEALQSQRAVVTALQSGPSFICDVLKALRDDVEMPTEHEEKVLDAAEDVPAILLFHLLARRVNIAIAKYVTSTAKTLSTAAFLRSPYEVWGLTSDEYDRQVMSGFGVAEERARRVALAWKGELERVAPEVNKLSTDASAPPIVEIKGWLRSLGLALQARTGITPSVSF